MKHRLICFLAFTLSAVFLCSCPGVLFSGAAESPSPENPIADVRVAVDVSARAAILMEEVSGTVLFERTPTPACPWPAPQKL